MATHAPLGGLELEGRTYASVEKSHALIMRLERWLDPFVVAVLKKNPLSFQEKLDAVIWFFRLAVPILLFELLIRREFGRKELRETSGATAATWALVRAWLETLWLAAEEDGEVRFSDLDQAMLPKMTAELEEMFEDTCEQAGLNGKLAREILTAARRSLPASKPVPDEVAEYFLLEHTPIKY